MTSFLKRNVGSLFIIALLLILFVIYHYFINKNKLAYVRTGMLVERFQGMAESYERLEKEAKTVRTNIDTLKNRVLLLQAEYGKTKNKYQELSIAEKEYTSYSQRASQEIEKRRMELYKKNVDAINSFIKLYGEKHSYRYIFGATDTGNILYALDGEDITEKVLEGLNMEYNQLAKK